MERLRRGETSERVRALQRHLNSFFGQWVIQEDGDFGHKTERLVRDAQLELQQPATGVADEALFRGVLNLDVQIASEHPRCLDPQATWMRVAMSQAGMAENPGLQDNQRIVEYHAATTLPRRAHADETAWCSSFVNWVFDRVGIEGTRSALASSWLGWGRATPAREGAMPSSATPQLGLHLPPRATTWVS